MPLPNIRTGGSMHCCRCVLTLVWLRQAGRNGVPSLSFHMYIGGEQRHPGAPRVSTCAESLRVGGIVARQRNCCLSEELLPVANFSPAALMFQSKLRSPKTVFEGLASQRAKAYTTPLIHVHGRGPLWPTQAPLQVQYAACAGKEVKGGSDGPGSQGLY